MAPAEPFELTLPPLERFEGELAVEGDYDAVEFRGLDLTGQRGSRARFLDCGLLDCRLDDVQLRGTRFGDCLLQDLQAVSLDLADSTWRDCVLRRGRFGALTAHGASMMRLRVIGAKIDFVNLRDAQLTDVSFEGCQVAELDLGGAELSRVSFAGCRIEQLDVSGARLDEVDLSRAELHLIAGVASLAGAVISEAQLADLAPVFAGHLGVRVVPD